MSFDPSDYCVSIEEGYDLLRCSFPECRHADDEELDRCDSCRNLTCSDHAVRYTHFLYCHACGTKEREALRVARARMDTLWLEVFFGRCSADDAAAKLIGIAEDLERWDA